MEVAREPAKKYNINIRCNFAQINNEMLRILLTCVKCSAVDVPLYPHSGVAHRFDSGLEVNSSTFDLIKILQWYNETWRWINLVFFRRR